MTDIYRITHPALCQDYLSPIERIWTPRSVNIVSGASGAGKTILMAEWLSRILRGRSVCGYRTNPPPDSGLIVTDRDWQTYASIYGRVGLADITRYVLTEDPSFDPREWGKKSNAMDMFLRSVERLGLKRGGLVYVDAFAPLFIAGSQNDARDVALSLQWVRKIAMSWDLTFVLFANTAKQRAEDQYRRAQDRISGSGAFVAYSDTQVSIERDEHGILVCSWTPRLAAAGQKQFAFDEETGLFVPHYSDEAETSVGGGVVQLPAALARVFEELPADGSWTPMAVVVRAIMTKHHVVRQVTYRNINALITKDLIEKNDLSCLRRKVAITVPSDPHTPPPAEVG